MVNEKLGKILVFIEYLREQSDNWDKLCDCPASDNPMDHTKVCITMKARKRYDLLMAKFKRVIDDGRS